MFFGAHDPSAGSGEEYQGGFGPAEGNPGYVPGTDTPITIRTETIDIEGKVPSAGGEGTFLVPAEPVPEPAPGGTSTSSLLLIGVVGGLAVWLFWGKKKSRVRARRSSRRRARRPARRRR